MRLAADGDALEMPLISGVGPTDSARSRLHSFRGAAWW